MLKRLINITVILSVLGIAVLGFLSMADHDNHALRSCVGRVTGTNCPPVTQSLADVASHIAAAQKLGMAIPNPGVAGAALVMALGALILLPRLNAAHLPPPAVIPLLRTSALSPPPSLARRLEWLARHEARDPHASPPGAYMARV
jgi:hypothetical protein